MVRSRAARGRRQLTSAGRLTLSVGVICLLTGALVLAIAPGFTASVVGIGLLGLAGIAFVALVFLLVGESEDRDYGKAP